MRRLPAVVLACAFLVEPAVASVLCTKPRKDGTLNGSVKIRPACKPGEVVITGEEAGVCCTGSSLTSTTSTSTTTVSCPIHTTTSLGIPDCGGGGGACFGLCANARACIADETSGACGCTGAVQPCGIVTFNGLCGGSCPTGTKCEIFEPPLPNGCTDVPRCACVPTP
jgi:hypothetical protein